MANFRSLDSIILSMLDYLRIVQPDLDTKPGSVLRELVVDPTASELAKYYVELRNVANLQSISTATGANLDRLGRNFGVARGSGSVASGVAVFTTNSVDADINIPANTIVTARNGFKFKTIAATAFLASNASVYRANAIRMRSNLELAGIQDQYALEIGVEAISAGSGGNIGKFSLVTQSIAGISNLTNLELFTGGSNSQSDATFRARILGTFAGSNIGTALGYTNTLLANPNVIDVLTVEPGDPLMVRDGSQISTNSAGEKIVISSGTGGKVDLYIQGSSLEQNIESVIYRDQSGRNDATDTRNDIVLGQRDVNRYLDFQQKRRQLMRLGTLPFQPVEEVISLSGSLSGPNFVQKYIDQNGVVQGTYELVADEDAFGGSPFGFDKIHFLSNSIDLDDEGVTKGILNGEDALDFTGIISINEVNQNIVLRNEVPTLDTTDRSLIRVSHTPVVSVDRIINLITGERYTIAEFNPLGSDSDTVNESGVIKISGNTLPISTDILQVTYLWQNEFDENIDYDDLESVSNFRTVQDSIDWGFSNRILAEEHTVEYNLTDGYHVILENSASRVIDISTTIEEYKQNNLGKLVVDTSILNIVSIRDELNQELFYTKAANGAFSGTEITLPTDTLLANDGYATIIYNEDDLYSPDGYEVGTFSGNLVRLPDGVVAVGQTVYADYVANINTLVPTTALTSLPISGSENTFLINNISTGIQPSGNIYVDGIIAENARFAPSYLKLNVQGIPSRGRLTIKGTSFNKVEDVITIRTPGMTIDLSESLRAYLDSDSLASSIYIGYIGSVERVTVEGDAVTGQEFEFDILNYKLKNTSYSNETAIEDDSLSRTEFTLSSTTSNLENIATTGQRFKIVYYYIDTAQVENIVITASDTYYSKYKYLYVDKISIASGFTSLSGLIAGNITITNSNQPVSGTSYNVDYSYTAPKEGERLTITYNYNKLISDATFAIEEARPVTADVLIKAAVAIGIDVTVSIVATEAFSQNTANLQQAVEEAPSIFLTANGLNSTLDSSDVINALYSVSGVDRVIITKFNKSGLTGIKKTISADRNEFLVAGDITVNIEER